MATGTTKTVKRGPNRTLGVRTWLGAGALTLGVGAALAGATAVAQADTGGHAASSSASSSSSSKPDAGPKRTGVASNKRVSAPVAKVANSKPSVSAAAASKTAGASAQTHDTTQTIDTPFGPITVDISATFPDPGDSDDTVSLDLNASTPLGHVKFGLAGNETFTAIPQPPSATAQISFTEGKLEVPGPVAFLVSSAGSAVLGAVSAYNSATSFFTALQHGNIVGAAQAFLEAAPKLTHAVLFGQETLTLPIDPTQTGQPAVLSIPFGGFFAPLRPVSVTWPGYSYTDSSSGIDVQVTIDPVDVEFAGTKFGGTAAALGQLIGLL